MFNWKYPPALKLCKHRHLEPAHAALHSALQICCETFGVLQRFVWQCSGSIFDAMIEKVGRAPHSLLTWQQKVQKCENQGCSGTPSSWDLVASCWKLNREYFVFRISGLFCTYRYAYCIAVTNAMQFIEIFLYSSLQFCSAQCGCCSWMWDICIQFRIVLGWAGLGWAGLGWAETRWMVNTKYWCCVLKWNIQPSPAFP